MWLSHKVLKLSKLRFHPLATAISNAIAALQRFWDTATKTAFVKSLDLLLYIHTAVQTSDLKPCMH